MFTSYAQNFEDVMLHRALQDVTRGFYIDVGAQDPIVDSVSMGFYEVGWRGVHVEPVAAYAEQLRAKRPDEIVVEAALAAQHGTLRFHEVTETGLSTADAAVAARHRESGQSVREIEVPCLTLGDVMAPYADTDVHWLKIDVEGFEKEVLQGWTSDVRPWIVVVESTAPLTQIASHREWEDLVLAHGYTFAYFDGLNRFYIRADREDLRPAFAHGPSVFDHFTLSGTSSSTYAFGLCDRIEALSRAADAMGERVEDAERRAREAGRRVDEEQRRSAELRASVARMTSAVASIQDVVAAMEGTISWRVTAPLRWLSRKRNAVRARGVPALRAATGGAVRTVVSVARRGGLYTHFAPWLRTRCPRLWTRAKRLAMAAPMRMSPVPGQSGTMSVATEGFESRTTRDATIVAAAEIERRLEIEVRLRRRA
jgi:FkbM family methyltransferase